MAAWQPQASTPAHLPLAGVFLHGIPGLDDSASVLGSASLDQGVKESEWMTFFSREEDGMDINKLLGDTSLNREIDGPNMADTREWVKSWPYQKHALTFLHSPSHPHPTEAGRLLLQ